MRTFQAALGLLIVSTGAALADCRQRTNITHLGDAFPLADDATDTAKAILALPYGAMFGYVTTREAPPGFQRGPGPGDVLPGGGRVMSVLTGFSPATFVSCSGEAVVVVLDGLRDFDFRDYVAGGLGRAGGGYSRLALDFAAALVAAYPGHDVSIIGHSAGGDVASYVAGALGLPSITFNAARSEASLTVNDGSRQLNVIVRGDPVADRSPSLPGMTLYLDMDTERPHLIGTVVDGLAGLVGRSWPGA
jgi:hypothetical protein